MIDDCGQWNRPVTASGRAAFAAGNKRPVVEERNGVQLSLKPIRFFPKTNDNQQIHSGTTTVE